MKTSKTTKGRWRIPKPTDSAWPLLIELFILGIAIVLVFGIIGIVTGYN